MIELSFFAIISAFFLCIINSARKTLLLWLWPLRWYDCQLNLLCSFSGSQHLKMDAWNTIVSFWVYSLFSGAIPVSFSGGGGVNIQTVQPSEMFHNIFSNKVSNFHNFFSWTPNFLKLPNSWSSENPTKISRQNHPSKVLHEPRSLRDLALFCRKRSWNVV